jgi:hypothetical protein
MRLRWPLAFGLDVGDGGPNSSPLVRAWLLAISREKLMGNIHRAMCDDECRRIIAIVAHARDDWGQIMIARTAILGAMVLCTASLAMDHR